jgi:hypothetical protein
MPFRLHTMRSCCGAALALILAVTVLGEVHRPPAADLKPATVTGRVTCGGRPLGGMSVIFEATDPHGHAVTGPVMADGSFRMGRRDNKGLVPGTYHVYFVRHPSGPDPRIDPRYQDPGTSGLVVRVGPDWNEIVFYLPGRDGGPTVVRHRRVEAL